MPIENITRKSREVVLAQLPAFGGIAAIAGFLSDVLAPLAPISQYAGIAFILLAVGSLSLYGLLKNSRLLSAGVLCAFLGIANLGISVFQSYFQLSDTGILGGNIDAVASLQKDVGLISDKLDDIATTVEGVASNTSELVAESKKANTTLEQIREGFDVLIQSNDLIANPTSPEEYYVNAVKYMQRGNNAAATEMFLNVFTGSLQPIDAAEEYFNLLKTTKGTNAALLDFEQLIRNTENISLKSVHAANTVVGAPAKLLQLIEQTPTYAPLYYLYAQALINERELFKTPTTTRALARDSLEEFKRISERGDSARFFIDKRFLAKWVNNSDSMLKAFSELRNVSPEGSVTIAGQDGDWCFSFKFSDVERMILARAAPTMNSNFIILGEDTAEGIQQRIETWRDGSNTQLSLCYQATLDELKQELWFSDDGLEMEFAYVDLDGNRIPFFGRFPESDWDRRSNSDGSYEVRHVSGLGLLKNVDGNFQLFYTPAKPISSELRYAPILLTVRQLKPFSGYGFDAFGLTVAMTADVERNRYITRALSREEIDETRQKLLAGNYPSGWDIEQAPEQIPTVAFLTILEEAREVSLVVQGVGDERDRYLELGALYKFKISQSGARVAFSKLLQD